MEPRRETPALSPEELRRYSRHLALPEVSIEGQTRLKGARVLCVGAGGLGSPISLYLAAAGIGRLGVVDFDRVDLSNIQRQILYSTSDVGRSKLEAARERLSALNPHVEIVAHETRLTSENAIRIIGDYDIVADGTDNFATRYLVNDACVLLARPNVYASIFRFEGQVSLFDAPRGPCYRCLFPEPPPPGLVPSCAEGGVLGVLPGIIGSLQALEVIKRILGAGDGLSGRLVLFDALSFRFRELRVEKDPACPVCGTAPTITRLMDYEAFCGAKPPDELRRTGSARPGGSTSVAAIEVEELRDRLGAGESIRLIDVREPFEASIARIEGGELIPLGDLPARIEDLDRTSEYVVYCHTGVRSGYAVALMRKAGFKKVRNLTGGIDAWSVQVDPSVARY
jgi:sulfur-carrier protein adenylyltransferase/sulfurtransferase